MNKQDACIYLLFLCPICCSFFTDPSCNSIKQNKLRDQYKLFLQTNPEDDKPVAVVVPRRPCSQTTAVPECFAAGSFGLVTVFSLLLHNVPALQAYLLQVIYLSILMNHI
ncbi:hypothetical protein Peur_054507 [Populus x canadensis]